ncbi:bifunctional DNA primase/polymerase [Streptomyces meridianus]|uniref:Bifunctional DNA primase/polymerase n=1 Tax=Streptomyces meridianus TaxID=2938945 RepID=A0ABT0X2W6_9ACTN|nr:bifunctional DNA primase/polymerase [Streptomyces meridianus]MCM2576794.1 bifunctional DNA primase/polymerase [Streptomyces meridianus]
MTPTGTSRPAPPRDSELLDAAVAYARERLWDVHPGTWPRGNGDCSCAAAGDCPAPGAHPAQSDWEARATSNPDTVRTMWEQRPRASILLPAGRTFDVLDVPEAAGCLALARMQRLRLPVGPVACTPHRRMLFFVLPGTAAHVPDLARRMGWRPSSLDLMAWGEGHFVVAPPSRHGALGPARWIQPPTSDNRWLPDAEEIAGPVAYACARDAASPSGSTMPPLLVRADPGPSRVVLRSDSRPWAPHLR